MRPSQQRKPWLLLSVSLLCLSTPVEAQSIISANRRIDWTRAGVVGGIPARTAVCATLSPGATASQINSAIAACPANGVVFLNAGTYNLSSGITFGGRNSVSLRGAGPNQTLLKFSGVDGCGGLGGASVCIFNGNSNSGDGGNWGSYANWTAGYAVGTTSITLDAVTNLQVGSSIILDQCNDGQSGQPTSGTNSGCTNGTSADNGNLWICHAVNVCSNYGAPYLSRAPGNRSQMQVVQVTSISGTGPYTVGITPGLYAPNWRSSQSPGAWWSIKKPITMVGLEDLSLDTSGSTPGGVVFFFNAYNCWAKNIRIVNAYNKHVWSFQSAHVTVRDSYFYGTQLAASDSYGTNNYMSADLLIENNIFEHIATPLQNENSVGIVQAYNFSLDDYYTKSGSTQWQQGSSYHHGAGDMYQLFEGNIGIALTADDVHGTSAFITAFRNYYNGRDPAGGSIGGKTQQTNPVQLQAFNRYYNLIGNVLGTPGYHTRYEAAPTSTSDPGSGSVSNVSIYTLGFSGNEGTVSSQIPNDPRTKTTLMRWGNYDTVTGAFRWNASEVPSGVSPYGNPVPPDQTLPSSLYLSQPPNWFTTLFGGVVWPPIGPDVTGGALLSGFVHKIPAQLCYERTSKTGGILNFNAKNCYSTIAGPSAPTNLRIVP